MTDASEQWRTAYEDDGFVIVPDLLDTATLSRLGERLDQITCDPDQLPAHLQAKLFFERDHAQKNPHWFPGLALDQFDNAIRQIDDLALSHPLFADMICFPPLLDVLESLFSSSEFSLCVLTGRPKAARVGNGVQNGLFHRDTPGDAFTSANTIIVFLCLDAMTPDNGPTMLLRGSHAVSDHEAKQPRWLNLSVDELPPGERVTVSCPAGAGLFFSSKILHAAGHNRSASPRRTLHSIWCGPDVLPTDAMRSAYQGLKPRSRQPAYAQQARMTFPHLLTG